METISVLLIEDSDDDHALIERVLRKEKMHPAIVRVETEAELREALSSGSFDLVLSDYKLPGFDGLRAFEIVSEAGVGCPFIMVSGTIGEDVAVEAMRRGVSDYVLKRNLNRLGPAVHREMIAHAQRHQLGRMEAQLDVLLEQVPVIVWSADRDLRVIAAKGAGGRNLGIVPGSRLGLSLIDILADEPHGAEAIAAARRALAGDSVRFEGEFMGRIIDSTMSPLRSPSGEVTGVVGVATDTTERKMRQRQQESSSRLELIGRLAGGVAHDFNNLLTVITSYAELVSRALPDDPQIREDWAQVREAGRRGASLTRQLLAFSRQQVMRIEVADINEVVSGMVRMLERILGEDVVLEVSLVDDLDHVLADIGQLEQIVMNLVVNAREAMPNGGALTITTANDDSGHALLRVCDTGIGMPDDVKTRIFEPFFTTKDSAKGTGLGLSTVHGIVKQLGGTIDVESALARGTTFTVRLPRTTEPRAAAAGSQRSTVAGGSETILIVEDDDGVRSGIARLLRRAGYAVREAPTGDTALTLLRSGVPRIDLVLCDVVMPGLSGPDLATRLAEEGVAVPVLLMSGYAPKPALLENRLFLKKPFSAERLESMVRLALDGGAEPLGSNRS